MCLICHSHSFTFYIRSQYKMEKERILESGGAGISSGFLRTKISLKGNQSQLSMVSPFYGMKPELPPPSQLLGSEDLIAMFDLSGSYNRYCGAKKPKEDLATFLPQVCGAKQINRKADASCSLRQLIEKPPILGKEINTLSTSQMIGFKLAPGPVSDANRYFELTDIPVELAGINISSASRSGQDAIKDEEMEGKHGKRIKRSLDEMEDGEKRIKKHKGEEKEKKKKKKDKKKKKEKKNVEDEQKKMHSKKEAIAPFF